MKLDLCRMEFSGKLLKRGFWLYVWDIKGLADRSRHLYVGRTGDSSSPHASSPFRRIGQHLDTRLNAKGNALGKRLREAGVDAEACTFEMIAIGPIYDEQQTQDAHDPLRDKTAALERALAEELIERGYTVLGHHPKPATPDPELFKQMIAAVHSYFPNRAKALDHKPRFQPIRTAGGQSASEIVIRDRGRY